MSSAAKDMEHLAKWCPAIESYLGARPEWLDEHNGELWRAVLVQRRITAVALRDMRSAILLVDIYLRGNASGSRIEEHVAVRWLPPTTVRGWLLNWRQNTVAAERAMRRAIDAACDAYESVTDAELDRAAPHTALVWLLLNRMEQHAGRTREEVKAVGRVAAAAVTATKEAA